jgi:hypothetical protein
MLGLLGEGIRPRKASTYTEKYNREKKSIHAHEV